MNMGRIEAEIRMFDRIELAFAIGAAAAAAALLVMIAVTIRKSEVRQGRIVLALSMAVLVVTGIYTGTVVFADEESGAAENAGPRMDVNESAEAPGEAVLEITGNLFEGCLLKMTVADALEPAEEEPQDPAGQGGAASALENTENFPVEEVFDVFEENAEEEADSVAEEQGDAVEETDDAVEEREDAVEETGDAVEESGDAVEEADDAVEKPAAVAEESSDAVGETEGMDKTKAEEFGGVSDLDENTENAKNTENADADNTESTDDIENPENIENTENIENPENIENTETTEVPEEVAAEIEISIFAGPQYDDAAAREMLLAEQAGSFEAAGLVLKDAVIEGGMLRSISFGLREAGSKCIKAVLIFGEDRLEAEFILNIDGLEMTEEDNAGAISDNNSGIDPEAASQTGGDTPGEYFDSPDHFYEDKSDNAGEDPSSGESSAAGSGEQIPAEYVFERDDDQAVSEDEVKNDEDRISSEEEPKSDEEKAVAEDDKKTDEDDVAPVYIIRPDNEGSGFKVSAATETAIDKVYISEAREIRIIETNAEEIDDTEVVYTVNGETYPMEYGADYDIKKKSTNEGWQYEYVVAPHVFERDGYYNINITSRDKSGNISNNKTAGTEVSFVVDRTPPTVIVTNLADGGIYRGGTHEYNITLKDNTLLKYFRIYENNELKNEYLYDREKWINTMDETDVLKAPGGTVTLKAEASGESMIMEFEAEDESGNAYRSGSYNIFVGKSRRSEAVPFAVTAASLTFAAALAVKYTGSRRTAARRRERGR